MQGYLKVLQQIFQHPANQGKQVQALLRALNWQLTAKSQEVTEIDFYGYSLLVHNKEVARRLTYFHPYYDFNSMKFIENYLKPGDYFIDIGANIGIYTLLAASIIGSEGYVDAFEALPTTFERLKENVERNNIKNITLHPVATGEQSKTIQFTKNFDTRNHIINKDDMISNQTDSVNIPCEPIDNCLNNENHYAMAKIDVEGYELPTVKGAENLLKNSNPPVLLLEINEAFRRYNFSESDIINYLNQKGYEMAIYNAKNNSIEFTKYRKNHPNVLFIARPYKQIVANRLSN